MGPQPFTAQSNTINVAATTTASTSQPLPGLGNAIRIVNEGPNIAYVAIGASAQTATLPSTTAAATCTALLAGSDNTFTIPNVAGLQISAICRTGTATLDVQVGEGL